MARPLRIEYPDAVYHVMNRGAARQPIFLTQADRETFLRVLMEAWNRWRFKVHGYCLMDNHYHLCLQTPEANLSRIMRHINGVYTQRYNRIHDRDGPLFRGRYKALLIEAEDYLGQVIRYIHLNPVVAGIVKRPQNYPWSSHRDYLRAQVPEWLSKAWMLEMFETPRNFHEFVLAGNEAMLSEMYERRRWPIILGNEDFIERIRCAGKKPTREHVREDRRFVRPPLEKILTTVSRKFGVSLKRLVEGQRGDSNIERKAALWALRELGDYTHRQIAQIVGLGSEKTVGWACQEIGKRLLKDRRLAARLKAVQQAIGQPET